MRRTSGHLAGIGLIGVLLVTGGCTTLGPDFRQPEAEVEQKWLETGEPDLQSETPNYGDWWTVFNDPVLNALVETAYQQNLPLQISGLRIMQARAQLGVAIGSQYPQLQQAAGALTRVNLSENEPNFSPIAEDTFWTANVGFDAAWELDFWGRFRRSVESASANLASQVAAYDSSLVSLTAEVARVYIVLRTLEEQLAVARSNVETQRRGYQIANVKFRNGAVSELDPSQALTLLSDTQAQIPSLESR
jgi:outer membrane protein TolC